MAITNATNATPIVITSSGHGFASGDYVQIVGIVGNLAANGIWQITVVNANSFSLYDSVGADDYVSGGVAHKITADPTTTWDDDVDIQETTTTAGTGTVALGGPIATKFPYGVLEDGAVVEYLITGAAIEPSTDFSAATSCPVAVELTVNTPVSGTIVNGPSSASDVFVKMTTVIGQLYTIHLTADGLGSGVAFSEGTLCADQVSYHSPIPTPVEYQFEATNILLVVDMGFGGGVTNFTIEVSSP